MRNNRWGNCNNFLFRQVYVLFQNNKWISGVSPILINY